MSSANDFVIENGNLKKYLGSDENVVVPDGVKDIWSFAFKDNQTITSIVLPDTVTRIGMEAFRGCCGLADENGLVIVHDTVWDYFGPGGKVSIPDGVREISSYALEKNETITEILMPDSVTVIGYRAFAECESLMSVVISDRVKKLPKDAFSWCRKLRHVKLPKNLTVIESGAFSGCYELENIVFPQKLKEIGTLVFCYCNNIREIDIPDSVDEIKWRAFADCENLERILLPEKKIHFEKEVFDGCEGLREIRCPECYDLFIFGQYLEDNYLRYGMKLEAAFELKLQKKLAKNKEAMFEKILSWNEGDPTSRFLGLWKKVKLEVLDSYIDQALKVEKTEVSAVLLEYKDKQYSSKDREKAESTKVEKALGIKEKTITDWRKLFKIVTSGDAAVISGYKGTDNDVSVPAKVGKYAVTELAFLFLSQEDIRTVTIADGVVRLGQNAFYNLKQLSTVSIPASITEISDACFELCSNLVIHAPAGSYAETYAREHDIPFVAE